jgi:hypothetical protein
MHACSRATRGTTRPWVGTTILVISFGALYLHLHACIWPCIMHVHRDCVRRWRVGAPGPCMRDGLSERHTRFPSCSMAMRAVHGWQVLATIANTAVGPWEFVLWLPVPCVVRRICYPLVLYGVSLEPSYKVCICSTCDVLCTSVKGVRLLY